VAHIFNRQVLICLFLSILAVQHLTRVLDFGNVNAEFLL